MYHLDAFLWAVSSNTKLYVSVDVALYGSLFSSPISSIQTPTLQMHDSSYDDRRSLAFFQFFLVVENLFSMHPFHLDSVWNVLWQLHTLLNYTSSLVLIYSDILID